MTTGAIDALHADREAILKIGAGLTDAEWAAPSGCPGWSAKDVLAHLGALLRLVIDPASLPDATGLGTERAQDMYVGVQAVLGPRPGAGRLRVGQPARVRGPGRSGRPGPRGAAGGSRHLSGLADPGRVCLRPLHAHPRRPVPPAWAAGRAAAPSDELRLVPALDWVEAALPQQNAGRIAALTGGGADQRDRPGSPDPPPRPGRPGGGDQLRRPRVHPVGHPARQLAGAGRAGPGRRAAAARRGRAEGVLSWAAADRARTGAGPVSRRRPSAGQPFSGSAGQPPPAASR